jgi:hypothetical protein
MANVTFTSPVMAKDVTVYAIAGHRGTILSLAKANKMAQFYLAVDPGGMANDSVAAADA